MPTEPDDTLATIGEDAFVSRIIAAGAAGGAGWDAVPIGPGDDAAVVEVASGRLVMTTDLLVEGRHFRTDWSAAADVGAKAAAQNLADVVAMGAVPTSLLVSLGAPANTSAAWCAELQQGLLTELAEAGEALGVPAAPVVGGDVVGAPQVIVSVAAFGDLQGHEPVLRSGARPGDEVAVVGILGRSAAGYAALSRGFRSPREAVNAHRRPHPPYAEGPRAAVAGATSMTDVSDGLVRDADRIARASGVVVALASSALMVDDVLTVVGAAVGTDPMTFVLHGGEDHALLATFPTGTVPSGWAVIGSVRQADGESGVTVDGEVVAPEPWQHFG